MSNNADMIKLVQLLEGRQEFAGEKVGQKPGDQVRGTDKAKVGGKDHPFKGRLVGEDTTLEDKLAKKYQDFKDLQAKEKAEKKEKEELEEQGVAEGDKHSMLGKIQRGHELKKKVDTSFADIGKAQKAGDHTAASKAFRKHERYANLERPGTWTKVDEQGVAEGMLDHPGQEDSPVAQAIIRRILMQRTDLLAKYGPEKVGAAVDEVADWVGDVDEIGSSDVSGWVRNVERSLAEQNPVDEAAPALVKGAVGLAAGGIAAAGTPLLVATLGPILGIGVGAYGTYNLSKFAMKGADHIWDWAVEKLGGEKQADAFGITHARAAAQGAENFNFGGKTYPVTLKPEQAKQAAQVIKSIGESRMTEASNPADTVTLDVPLMIRLMEYAREDAGDDMALHSVAENLIKLSSTGRTLSMQDYDSIVSRAAEGQINELGATPPTPPQGTATGQTANTATAAGSISPDEQTALNKINQNPAMKQQLDKLMTQATPGGASAPMKLDPEEQDALDKIKANAGLGTQYAKLIKQANPAANLPAAKP